MQSYIFLDKIIAMTTESTTEKPVVPTLDLEKTESSGSVTKKKSLTKKFAGGLKKIVTPRSRTSSMSSVQSATETAKEEPVKETYADIAKKAPADEETEAVVEEKAASRLATEGTEAASEAEPVEKKPTHAGTKGVLGGVVAAVVVVAAILLSKGSKKEPEPVVEEKKKKGLFA